MQGSYFKAFTSCPAFYILNGGDARGLTKPVSVQRVYGMLNILAIPRALSKGAKFAIMGPMSYHTKL